MTAGRDLGISWEKAPEEKRMKNDAAKRSAALILFLLI
jgi:hypothetical protein